MAQAIETLATMPKGPLYRAGALCKVTRYGAKPYKQVLLREPLARDEDPRVLRPWMVISSEANAHDAPWLEYQRNLVLVQ